MSHGPIGEVAVGVTTYAVSDGYATAAPVLAESTRRYVPGSAALPSERFWSHATASAPAVVCLPVSTRTGRAWQTENTSSFHVTFVVVVARSTVPGGAVRRDRRARPPG